MNKKALLEVLYFWISISIVFGFMGGIALLAQHYQEVIAIVFWLTQYHHEFMVIMLLSVIIIISYVVYNDAKREDVDEKTIK